MLRINIYDNGGLDKVRVFLTDPDGNMVNGSEMVLNISEMNLENEMKFDASVQLYRPHINLPQNTAEISYTATVEAEDKRQNKANSSVTFTIHAPDLNRDEFISTAGEIDFGQYFDWNGIVVPKEPEGVLSLILFVMTDKDYDNMISEAEWKEFTEDFDLKDQAWPAWDEDGGGSLSDAEFNTGINKLNLYTDWNLDKNTWIDSHELASGIFGRWDHNKDNLLSREEYEERFYRYYYFGG